MRILKDTLFVAVIFLLGLSSCTYDMLPVPEVEVPDTVSFSLNIIPIFDEKGCNQTGCHTTGSVAPDLTPENAYISLAFLGYVDTEDPETSIIYQKITVGSMKNFADEQSAALILAWIQQGALNN